MQRYRLVILIVLFGVLPVVAAFFIALSFLKDEARDTNVVAVAAPAAAEQVEAPPPPPPEARMVVMAARDLPVGTLIGEDDLGELAVEAEAVRRGHILIEDGAAADTLRHHAVREALASGEAITWSSVVGPGQPGFLAAVLRPGTRAVTIRVGPATSHAGLVDPGDRVDVILTAELQTGERERSVLSRTIIEDVRVVAVDRRIGNDAGPSGDADDPPAGDGGVERTEIITATLEVSPAQGDRVVLGEHEGKLSLAVRPLAAAASQSSGSAVELQDLFLPPQPEAQVDTSAEEERPPPEEEPPPPEARSESPLRKTVQVRVFRGSEPAESVEFTENEE